MQGVGIVGAPQQVGVAGRLDQRAAHDHLERRSDRCLRAHGGALRLQGGDAIMADQTVPALGLALEGQGERRDVHQPPRQVEQRLWRPGQELQLQLGDGIAPLARNDRPGVERDLDLRRIR